MFNAWPKNFAQMQGSMRLQFGPAGDKAISNFKGDTPKNTTFSATSDSGSPIKAQCHLKDGGHRMWHCEKFKKKKKVERREVVKKCNLCFSCLNSRHRFGQCKATQTWGKNACAKCYKTLLPSDGKESKNQKEANSNKETANIAEEVKIENSCSWSLQIVSITFSSRTTSAEVMAIPDTGYNLSSVDKGTKYQFDAKRNELTLKIAATDGTKLIASEEVRVKVETPMLLESLIFHVHTFTHECILETYRMTTMIWEGKNGH